MRVATYNIASGHTFETYAQTGKSVFDPMRIASFIDTLGADVITLNEIASQFSTEDGTINEVEQIAEHCGYEASAFARGTVFPPTRDLGNAILSKFPILEARVIPVPAPTENERRAGEDDWYEDRAILCCVLAAFGTKIRYITTHFGLNPQEKERMMSALCGLLAESEMPTVLSGDFNAPPHAEILKPLYDKYVNAAEAVGAEDSTLCPPMESPMTVDHIFVSRHFEVSEYRVIKRVLSDHYPCVAQLRLKN